MSNAIAAQLADILGADAVVPSAELADYAVGALTPAAAVRPADADGVAAALRWAGQADFAVYPVGGRTQIDLGNPATRPGIALDLTDLNQLIDFQPADLTVTVAAGMTLAQLDAIVGREDKCVPIWAPLAERATVGGVLAAGASGPLRSAYGLPRDWLIGISVAGADGTLSKAGGKVVKNVTGYDLNRLYTGSLGTLAVITEATFKIAPAPREWAVIFAAFHDADAASEACLNLRNQPFAPLGLHLLNPAAAQRLAAPNLPVGYGPVAVAIVGGRPAAVQRQLIDTALLWLGTLASVHIERDDPAAGMAALANLPAGSHAIAVRINAPPAALSAILGLEACELAGAGPPGIVADVGFGGGRLFWWDDFTDADPAELAGSLRKIQDATIAWGGDAVIERCPEPVKRHLDIWGPQPSGFSIMRRLKQQFDPNNILNPGRFIGGL